MGNIEIIEQVYRIGSIGSRFRPFSEYSNVNPRGYCRHLQRVICDFGADHAFGQVSTKLKEHYGISVPYTASGQITETHAGQIQSAKELYTPKCQDADIIIAESDGSMIPIVETTNHPDSEQDRRRNKQRHWKEARLSLAHAKDSITPYFAATLDSVSEAGQQLLTCVNQSGAHEKTKVHCVGDGAVWIANQVEERFGSNGTYLQVLGGLLSMLKVCYHLELCGLIIFGCNTGKMSHEARS